MTDVSEITTVERTARALHKHAPDGYDPASDDMTVKFAIDLAEQDAEIARLRDRLTHAHNTVDEMADEIVLLHRERAALVEAVNCLMDQPIMNPLEMTPEQRKELWAAHDKARAAARSATETKDGKPDFPPQAFA